VLELAIFGWAAFERSLGLTWRGQMVDYRSLCLGENSAPRWFSKRYAIGVTPAVDEE